MFVSGYITTVEVKNDKPTGKKHHYRMTPWEITQHNWAGEFMTDFRPAGEFRFSEIISDESARRLYKAVSKAGK